MVKKLSFNETMLMCGLLREVNIKQVVQNVTSSEFDARLNALETDKEKQALIALEVITYILENLENGQEKLSKLLSSYLEKEAESLDIDDIFEGLKSIIISGLPKVITDIIDIEKVKKKMKIKKSK